MPKKKPGIYTAKNGARYKILANGRARFISGPKKKKSKKGGGLKDEFLKVAQNKKVQSAASKAYQYVRKKF